MLSSKHTLTGKSLPRRHHDFETLFFFFIFFFFPFLKSISGINVFHSKSCKESVFLPSAALLAALLQPLCERAPPDQIRCTTRCLFCCPGVEHQEPQDCDQLNKSEQTHGNKHHHPDGVIHSHTGNLQLDFSEFRALFLHYLWFPGDHGQLEQISPLCKSQCKVRAPPECLWH